MVALLHNADAWLLAFADRFGLQTLQQLMAAEVDTPVGPQCQHNPIRRPHGMWSRRVISVCAITRCR